MKKEVESVVSLIRRYVYGLDYYDEEWNQRILNNNDFITNGVIALTNANGGNDRCPLYAMNAPVHATKTKIWTTYFN